MQEYFNLTVKKDGPDKLVIEIDLTAEGRLSGTGKTITKATMGKPKVVAQDSDGQDIYLGVNCFKYPPR